MECRTASACAALEVSWCQLGNRESLGGESLLRRVLRGIFGVSGVATDDCEGCLRVYCEWNVSVGVKRERYIRLSSL